MSEVRVGSSKSELLFCPFCGGRQTYRKHDGGVWLTTTNHKRGCIMRDALAFVAFDTEAEAIAAWNSRAERTCKVAACYDTADVDSRGSNAEWYFAFTCGDELYWDEPEPPSFCPDCGAHVLRNTSKYSETDATLGGGECKKLPSLTDSVCIVRRGGMETEFGYWRCSKCGCENFEGAKYCMNCGAKVVGE